MVISDKSQGSVATHFSYGGYVLLRTFRLFAGERIYFELTGRPHKPKLADYCRPA